MTVVAAFVRRAVARPRGRSRAVTSGRSGASDDGPEPPDTPLRVRVLTARRDPDRVGGGGDRPAPADRAAARRPAPAGGPVRHRGRRVRDGPTRPAEVPHRHRHGEHHLGRGGADRCLYLAPAGWLPAAALLGTGTAWTIMSLAADRRPPVELLRIAASLTAATALAVAVTTAIGEPLLAAPHPGARARPRGRRASPTC